jgi:pyruvate/2-oxoglutarate dehydrogenase complex dihydrolipoamide acyltransferase (E2) component
MLRLNHHGKQAIKGLHGNTMKGLRKKTSEYRKLSIYGFDMVMGGHNFFALLEFDVTDVRKELRAQRSRGEGGSLFSFLLKAIGRCLEEQPEFNSMINLSRTTSFSEVDIAIPIEVMRDDVTYNKQYILRAINEKSVREIDDEIETVKSAAGEEKTYMSSRMGQKIIARLPRFIVVFLFRQILKNHEMVKRFSGTVFVTSVSMVTNVPGFILPYSGGPKAVSFALGSVVKKPVVRKDTIVVREMMNITAIFNHDSVDGAPAARFINLLRRYIEQEYRSLL